MAKYRYHRLDQNHAAIRAALERAGATVVPDGPVDLVVGYRGRNYLLEVKTEKGKLRTKQETFVRRWKGQVAVVRTPDEALLAIGLTVDRPVQPRVAEAIRDRAEAGEPVPDLAEDYQLSRSVVRRILASEPHD